MKENEVDGAAGDATVGKIEYRLKEDVPSQARNPVRPRPQGEVEHIHHPTLHKRRIGTQRGHGVEGGLAENEPVEQAVHDVAESAGRDERKAHKDPGGDSSPLHEGGYPPAESTEENYAEDREEILAYDPAEGHSKGHALVFHK